MACCSYYYFYYYYCPITSPECQSNLAKVEDIVKSFAFESEMSGNIWSDCLRDRFDFQTSISAEQADTSLTDLLFASQDFCVETREKTFFAEIKEFSVP